MLASREMPPAKAERQPERPGARRGAGLDPRRARQHEARRNAGDPGPVLARRLSNAEYDYTIRDLTGVDIRPTREFPVDPANEAGFDNSGESLVMSPALLKKYLDAARGGRRPPGAGARRASRFAPHPVVTDTDRDRYAVERIVRFYQRQPTDLGRYFHAAWRFQHRAALGKPRRHAWPPCAAADRGQRRLPAHGLGGAGREAPRTFGPLARVQRHVPGAARPAGRGRRPRRLRAAARLRDRAAGEGGARRSATCSSGRCPPAASRSCCGRTPSAPPTAPPATRRRCTSRRPADPDARGARRR